MLFRNFGRLALAAAAALVPSILAEEDPDNPNGQSTFISPGGQVAFALTVPDHNNVDIYFNLRVPVGISWGAVGLGSEDMDGALYLMIYKNEKGDNVTFSPRLANGHYEPKYYEEMEIEVLNGTGIYDDHMVFVARCAKHCRSWPAGGSNSGWFDVSSSSQKAIYAFGPKEGFASDRPTAPLKYHQEFGTFTIDSKRTQGVADAPVLTEESENEGTTLDSRQTGKSDWKTTLHGVVMIFCIVGMLPLGVVLLRFGGWVRWHGINQTVALVGVLGGFALGIATSFQYQRSRGFDSTHQIIGILVVAFMLGQFGIGFLHHRQYKQTQAPTKYGRIHRWLGRAILFIGTLNAFIGFTLALNRKYGMILAGLIILICVASLLLLFGKRFIDKRAGRGGQGPLAGAPPTYPQEPWRQQPPPNSGYPSEPPPGYEAPPSQNNIGLRPVSPMSPWRSSPRHDDDEEVNLGREQRAKEFT
ncbi:Fc.00g102540.m01.CDS01 [Cosmosporella sp. VM-42]